LGVFFENDFVDKRIKLANESVHTYR
jgi:hypothetical protein